MKKMLLIKENVGNDLFISIVETEEDPDEFLRKNGYSNYSWTYIRFGQKKRISKNEILHR